MMTYFTLAVLLAIWWTWWILFCCATGSFYQYLIFMLGKRSSHFVIIFSIFSCGLHFLFKRYSALIYSDFPYGMIIQQFFPVLKDQKYTNKQDSTKRISNMLSQIKTTTWCHYQLYWKTWPQQCWPQKAEVCSPSLLCFPFSMLPSSLPYPEILPWW